MTGWKNFGGTGKATRKYYIGVKMCGKGRGKVSEQAVKVWIAKDMYGGYAGGYQPIERDWGGDFSVIDVENYLEAVQKSLDNVD